MAVQGSAFSPQAVLERLTGEKSPEETSHINLANAKKSNIHALVIGINDYLHHSHLRGAVNDANLFKSYLLSDLLVPETHITTLFNTQATRSEIIQAFKNLSIDPNIEHGDPIVIFYAGHGAEVQPPPNRRAADGSRVQCLVPQDAGTSDLSSAVIPPIPDFTISSLLSRIASAKGDNLTVIFDSCHSASITRIGRGRGSRSIPSLCFHPLPEDIDSDIIAESPSIVTRSLRASHNEPEVRGMQSHVLLAACSSKGLAYEDLDTIPHHGYFTTALLKILRSVGPARLTYKSCIQRMPKLESSVAQHPVCEGINVNRMFFNAMISGADNSFILLEEKRSELYLQAGAVHGITPGCLFAIHADLILDPTNPPLGTMVVNQVLPFRSLLKFGDDTPSFAIPKPAYGRQIGAGNEHALDIYITPEFEEAIPPDPRWKVAFSGKEKDVVLRLVEKDLAELIIDVDDDLWATFTLPRLQPAIDYGITKLKRAVPTEFQDVYRVISAAARFIWHLERFPQSRPFQAGVKMEFYKLKESGKYEETGSPVLEIDGDDLNEGGAARLTVNSEDRYGFHIINTTPRDLYAYLFYFSVTTLGITSKFLPVVGSGQVDPSLPKGETLPLGYGSGGVKPFQFSLRSGETLDVGVFKLFLSTAPIDLASIEQPLPFRIEPRRLIRENEAKHQFGTLQVGVWDAITMELELTQSFGDLDFEGSSFEYPEKNTPPEWDEGQKDTSEPMGPFDNLIWEKQYALLKGFKLTCGFNIDPDSGPRFSDMPVSVLTSPTSKIFEFHNTTITEEVASSSMIDAAFVHNGFPPLNDMSNVPLLEDLLVLNDGVEKWTTRRIIIGKLNFSASIKDFEPSDSLVSDVLRALDHSKNWEKLKALKEVVETWGLMIPLSGVIGYSSVATAVDGKPDWPRPPLREEPESGNYDNFRVVKVTRVASILELLDDSLQNEIKQLYATLIFRSPCVGTHQLSGFDGTMNRSRRIQEIEVGFSDLRIESLTVRYHRGVVSGPYGVSGRPAQLEQFNVARDEGITDIIVWATDSQISSLQIIESSGRASPIYGAKAGATQPPKLLSGNGCFLVGLSGGFDQFGITQIQAIWRGDTHMKGYRRKQIYHVGGQNGAIWSDLTLLDNPLNSRISMIAASMPNSGTLDSLQISYTSLVHGFPTLQSTPIYGTAKAPITTWYLDEEECIIGARGRHDGKAICELQLVTNRLRRSPTFGQPFGNIHFDIKAPKTDGGEDMVLQCMVGKSAESVNSISLVWAEPVDWQTLQPGLTVIPPQPMYYEANPGATFYNLCAKSYDRINMMTSFEEHLRTGKITRPTSAKPSLHALVIGINTYESYNHLAGATVDAFEFKQYLIRDLLVPHEQIKVIFNEQATKWNIILALQDLAREDNGINRGDSVVIYYAGYGSEVDPPPDQVLNRSPVHCIIPQDTSKVNGVYPIPYFTIAALVHKIAREKGNNITLIFDCGYSLSGIRGEMPPNTLPRVIDKKDLPSLPTYSDRITIHDALHGSDIDDLYSLDLSSPRADTHVLLTACGYQESAFENSDCPGYGYFSRALLETLRSVEVHSLTYEGLIQRLSTLKTNMVQNPCCKGKDIERILFDGQVKGTSTSIITIEPKEDGLYLQAGLVQGITPGFKYAIHSGDSFGPSDTVIGTLEVDQVDPFAARLKGGNALDLPSFCYGRRVGYGPDQALPIYITEDFVKAAERSGTWSRILRGEKDNTLIRPTSLGLAQVILSVYGKKETSFKLRNQVSIKYGIGNLPLPGRPSIPPSASQVVPILSALAKWHWYLRHAPASRPFQELVDLEFYKLHHTEEYTDSGNPILGPEGENLIVGGEVNIVANPEGRYGIRIVNRSSADLYVYLFSFSPTSLAITHKSIPPIGSPGALLPGSESLTIGYGPDEQAPFTFSIDDALRMDVTILRLFISTHPADIEGVEQESPFEANGALVNERLKYLFGREAVWDVIGINVACKRPSRKDEGIIEPFGGLTIISDLEPTTTLNPDPTITPNLELGITPVIGADTSPTSPLLALFPVPAAADPPVIPPTDGTQFTGKSSTRRMVEALTADASFLPWFCTPALTPELLASIRCMRLRTLGSAKGPSRTNSSTETGGYFEISVIGSDGFPKLSTKKKEMKYRSHSAPASAEWIDGMVFEEDHELWGNLGAGDYFEVSVCAKGKGWICEANMGNLTFW